LWHPPAGSDLSQGKSSTSFEFGAQPTSLATADETASITKALPSSLTIHIDQRKVRYLLGDAAMFMYKPLMQDSSHIRDYDAIFHAARCNMQAFGKESTLETAEDFTDAAVPNCGIILIGEGDIDGSKPSGRMHLPGGRQIRVPVVSIADGNVLCCTG
jgi:hypothetical protein